MSLPVVAIVGRPNVGKSTLFNRIVGSRRAMVHDRPGVTRDRLYEEAEVHDRQVLLVDTGGLEADPETDLLQAMRRQTMVAVEEADVIVFVVDGQLGWTPADADVADLLRRTDTPVILCVNKVDGLRHEEMATDFYGVGLHPMVLVSAEHGRGVFDLYDALLEALPAAEEEPEEKEEEGGPIRIAVIGRPNIGKSTLVNALLGEDRHLVFDQPGTTTDPIDSPLRVGDKEYVLVDTAGVRKKGKIDDIFERWVSLRSIRAIERCHVSLLLIDGTEGPTEQEAKLAQLVIERGRALAILVNKWDVAKDLDQVNSFAIERALDERLPHATWAPRLFISAKTGKGVHRILPMVDKIYEAFDKRISTSKLNKWFEAIVEAHSPPQKHHHPVRIYYINQARVRPPTFVMFTNTPDGVTDSYQRFLVHRMRDEFGFEGSPVKLHIRERRQNGSGD